MRTIALLTQKGGAGRTTLAASLAVAAAQAGEKVIGLDLDPQASLSRWAKRREARNTPDRVMIEPLEGERLPHLRTIVEGLADMGFSIAIFDTPGADGGTARSVTEVADLCLLPTRPTCLDVDATAATFRAVFLAKRKAAFVLNQCPPTYRSSRTSESAKGLTRLGILAEPLLYARMDFQDAIAAGLGVTEYARTSRAAREIEALWAWIGTQFEAARGETFFDGQPYRQAAA